MDCVDLFYGWRENPAYLYLTPRVTRFHQFMVDGNKNWFLNKSVGNHKKILQNFVVETYLPTDKVNFDLKNQTRQTISSISTYIWYKRCTYTSHILLGITYVVGKLKIEKSISWSFDWVSMYTATVSNWVRSQLSRVKQKRLLTCLNVTIYGEIDPSLIMGVYHLKLVDMDCIWTHHCSNMMNIVTTMSS